MDNKSEIIELQTRVAFQDEALQTLSDTVARQQRLLEELQQDVEELQRQLRALQPSEVEGETEPPPPHY